MSKIFRLFLSLPTYGYIYLVFVFSLFLYSFTQIDLGLTLVKYPFFHNIQKAFQWIGYFNRPLSTILFCAVITLLFVSYFVLMRKALANNLKRSHVWTMIITTSVLLSFSYSAFSHDFFNYMFDAKIVTYYMENPYEHKALDYPSDPMLGFMHWTHRTYPYGPVWLALTVPLSYIGMQSFLVTFFLFKILMSVAYVGTAYFLEKILGKITPGAAIAGLVFFAFNPLVLVEGLVSSHHDVVMMFFAVLSLYLFMSKKKVAAFAGILISAGIKFATIFLLPIFVVPFIARSKNLAFIMALSMLVPVIFASIRTELQPWYLLWVIPFVALVVQKSWIRTFFMFFSYGILFQYAPYLYNGNFDAPYPDNKVLIIGISAFLSVVIALILKVTKRA
jgi:hypothetical protein